MVYLNIGPRRGNDTYSKRLYGKFVQYKDKFREFVGSVSKDFTKSMMVTLTISRELNLNDAWTVIGEWYNVFMTRLKDWVKRYCGKLPIVFRSWRIMSKIKAVFDVNGIIVYVLFGNHIYKLTEVYTIEQDEA